MDTATTEPKTIRAGDTISWRREDLYFNYPATTWNLTYHFQSAAATFVINAANDGDEFEVLVNPSVTANYTPGEYRWVAVVTNGTSQFTIDSGHCQVLPNLSAAGPIDTRTFAKKMLDAIESVMLGQATSGDLHLVAQATGDRSASWDKSAMLPLRDHWRRQVALERAAEKIADGENPLPGIQVRLG